MKDIIFQYVPEYEHYKNSEKFENKLHKIKRWHGELQMLNGDSESDLEHTIEMMRMTQEFLDNTEFLRKEISDDVYRIELVHDSSEIFVGDPPQELTKQEREEHDIKERRIGMIAFSQSKEWQELYRRSFDVEDNDKEALFSKYMDKVQAGSLVMTYFRDNADPEKVISNLDTYTLPHSRQAHKKLRKLLSEKAQSELDEYQNIYEEKIKETRDLLTSKAFSISNS